MHRTTSTAEEEDKQSRADAIMAFERRRQYMYPEDQLNKLQLRAVNYIQNRAAVANRNCHAGFAGEVQESG